MLYGQGLVPCLRIAVGEEFREVHRKCGITFEQISDFEVRGTAEYKGVTVSGIFKFNEQYEMVSFTTTDRKDDKTPWTAECGDYEVAPNGINLPTTFRAVWNFADGDFVYFDGKISDISYG